MSRYTKDRKDLGMGSRPMTATEIMYRERERRDQVEQFRTRVLGEWGCDWGVSPAEQAMGIQNREHFIDSLAYAFHVPRELLGGGRKVMGKPIIPVEKLKDMFNLQMETFGRTMSNLGVRVPPILFGGIGSTRRYSVYFMDLDLVFCGCFTGTYAEFVAKVKDQYGKDERHGREYRAAIKFLKRARKEFMEDDGRRSPDQDSFRNRSELNKAARALIYGGGRRDRSMAQAVRPDNLEPSGVSCATQTPTPTTCGENGPGQPGR